MFGIHEDFLAKNSFDTYFPGREQVATDLIMLAISKYSRLSSDDYDCSLHKRMDCAVVAECSRSVKCLYESLGGAYRAGIKRKISGSDSVSRIVRVCPLYCVVLTNYDSYCWRYEEGRKATFRCAS